MTYFKPVVAWTLSTSLLTLLACRGAGPGSDDQQILLELEHSLQTNLLATWYPAAIDSVHGGFLCDFDAEWRPNGSHHKMLVTQTRHIWTTSKIAAHYDDSSYLTIAKHGVDFIRDKMWDNEFGGFFEVRDRAGNELAGARGGSGKTAYSSAFAIYGLAAYYAVSHDSAALDLATATFDWLEKYSRDPEFGGYFDRLERDGSLASAGDAPRAAMFAGQDHWKDYNSSIHLMEAFSELYKVWPDSLLRLRLEEMLAIVRDRLIGDKGYQTLFLERDLTPISLRDSSETFITANYYLDHVSFGHDVETAYLLLEASHALGLQEDTQTLRVAKSLVDHTIANGWDEENGGIYDSGYYFSNADSITILRDAKVWWGQAEALNSLLLMSQLFPHEQRYREFFGRQWRYIKTWLIDHERGDWYELGLDKNPEQVRAPKGRDWKVNYHNARTLINCINMFKSEMELTGKVDF